MLEIFDLQGQKRDWAWVQDNYGNVQHREGAAGPAYRLVLLQEAEGPPTYIVKVRNQEGLPASGVEVARRWPESSLPTLPSELATWYPQGVYGRSEAKGVEFGGGHGDFYFPQLGQQGGSAFWCQGLSDCVDGVGFLGQTKYRHLDMTFQWVVSPQPTTYTLVVTIVGQGSVQTDPPGGPYTAGTQVTLTAVPATGWKFIAWSGAVDGTQTPAVVTMNANAAVTATFEPGETPSNEVRELLLSARAKMLAAVDDVNAVLAKLPA